MIALTTDGTIALNSLDEGVRKCAIIGWIAWTRGTGAQIAGDEAMCVEASPIETTIEATSDLKDQLDIRIKSYRPSNPLCSMAVTGQVM